MKPSDWLDAFRDTGVLTGATKNGGLEYVAYCPNCETPGESKSASASFNFKEHKFYCFSCNKQFPWEELLQYAREDARERRAAAGKEGGGEKKKETPEEPLPSSSQIERWRKELYSTHGCLQAFKDKRGLSEEIIAKHKIGYRRDKRRFTVPIYDIKGDLVNVRYYSLRARSQAKMINHPPHGRSRLVGFEALEHDEILLVEGEMDWLTALDQGFNAMTWTSGVTTWQNQFSVMFENKTVFICFDDDEAGRNGAKKVALELAQANAKVHIVQLQIPGIKGGDLTDYFHALGNSPEDFKALMDAARLTVAGQYTREKRTNMAPKDLPLERSMDSDNIETPVRMIATVHGKTNAPSHLPKEISYQCSMNWGDRCGKCGLSVFSGERVISLDAGDREVINMIQKTDEQVKKSLMGLAEIPPTCPKVAVESSKHWTVEELQVMPAVETIRDVKELEDEDSDPVDRTVYRFCTKPNLRVNKTYAITGISTHHPKDQTSIFQAWQCDPVEVDIERFRMTPAIYEQLKIFQPDDWSDQSCWSKLNEIARDLAINITKIYGRPELHIGMDLVWHSVNAFYFGGQLQVRGWVEGLVIGDTRTGKSEIANRLMEHYRSGTMVNAEATSFAGLIGGVSQKGVSRQWGITWGIIPLNDRRLVILDEAGGIKPEIISAMSSVRSQGVAEVAKMGGKKTKSRTRLIWIANPVTKRTIIEMTNGVMDEIPEFIPTPEDIARFDFAMAAASGDVPKDVQKTARKNTEAVHIHEADDCKQLITWCWSRKPEHIIFVKDTEEYIRDQADDFSDLYVPDLPLVQQQSFYMKLARLSVAVAARLFSTDETGEKVLVGRQHVDTAIYFLHMIYGMESFGYKTFSLREHEEKLISEANRDLFLDVLWGKDDRVRRTLLRVINHGKFKNRDFEERAGMMRDEAAETVDELLQLGMLKSLSRGYLQMTPVGLEIMREVRREEDLGRKIEAKEEAARNQRSR